MIRFACILSHPGHPEEGLLCYIDAESYEGAVDEVEYETHRPESMYGGYGGTVCPIPVSG